MTRKLDLSRVSHLASRPGADTRVWLSYATVQQVGYDRAHGIFVDVKYLPEGNEDTVYLGTSFAGDDEGDFNPVRIGETVLVAIPNGDQNTGPVIVARGWNPRAKPPLAFQDGEGTTDKRFIVSKKQLTIDVTGTEDFIAKAGRKVVLQDGSQPFVRGTTYADALGLFLDGLKVFVTAVGVFVASAGAAVVLLAPAALVFAPAVPAFIAIIDVFKASRANYLSTKVSGQ